MGKAKVRGRAGRRPDGDESRVVITVRLSKAEIETVAKWQKRDSIATRSAAIRAIITAAGVKIKGG